MQLIIMLGFFFFRLVFLDDSVSQNDFLVKWAFLKIRHNNHLPLASIWSKDVTGKLLLETLDSSMPCERL